MLELIDVSISYGSQHVIKGLSYSLPKAEVCGLAGLNGAGKTTLLKGIFDAKMRQSGDIRWEDRPLRWQEVALMPAEPYLYPYLKGNEYLDLFQLGNPDFDRKGWNELMELPLDKIATDYSSGMKKKLAFLALMIQDKPVMLIDEPFNNLDLETVMVLRRAIMRLREKGKTIIVTSHIPETLTDICDTLVLLKDGAIAITARQPDFQPVFDRMQEETAAKSRRVDDLLG